jgi:hypothetical protein
VRFLYVVVVSTLNYLAFVLPLDIGAIDAVLNRNRLGALC